MEVMEPFDLIHFDIWGTYKVQIDDGFYYFFLYSSWWLHEIYLGVFAST